MISKLGLRNTVIVNFMSKSHTYFISISVYVTCVYFISVHQFVEQAKMHIVVKLDPFKVWG